VCLKKPKKVFKQKVVDEEVPAELKKAGPLRCRRRRARRTSTDAYLTR
jgi:hypothetical protein